MTWELNGRLHGTNQTKSLEPSSQLSLCWCQFCRLCRCYHCLVCWAWQAQWIELDMCTAKRKNKLWFIDLLFRTNGIEFTRQIVCYKWLQPFHFGCLSKPFSPTNCVQRFSRSFCLHQRIPTNKQFLLDETKHSQRYNYLTYRFFAIVVFHIWNCPLENVARFGGFGNSK